APEARDLLRATYLRPLRDAEQALAAGRGSRLAQVLRHSRQIGEGNDECDLARPLSDQHLSVLGIARLVETMLKDQQGVEATRSEIDRHLSQLTLQGDRVTSTIGVHGSMLSDDARLRELLERLDLRLEGVGRRGLGSNNILFMACELLLLAQGDEGSRLLLIEEPEAHLHAQRQLRAMRFLQSEAEQNGIQVIVTTHSPNLASVIDLNNILMLAGRRAFSMAEEYTSLEPSDYRFLQRFLDATKANLFFARGVMIVEGDAENILLPTLARLIGRDFTEHGVSIVNVGGIGLRRYARIFQRKNPERDGRIPVPVACITDLDVMPDCAPKITEKRGHTRASLGTDRVEEKRRALRDKAFGQYVKTFVAEGWTLEYDLAISGLAQDVFVAATLARKDDSLRDETLDSATREAEAAFAALEAEIRSPGNGAGAQAHDDEEVLASKIYALFTTGTKASKAIAAQYLARRLEDKIKNEELTAETLRERLPKYLIEAIDYVTQPREEGTVPVGTGNNND
ncbi:MAG: AAA family ATPase, partial [Phycisphaeraceae bacterium]|nr:AAA family ATPase [Phycisphaeraceae bacterium]